METTTSSPSRHSDIKAEMASKQGALSLLLPEVRMLHHRPAPSLSGGYKKHKADAYAQLQSVVLLPLNQAHIWASVQCSPTPEHLGRQVDVVPLLHPEPPAKNISLGRGPACRRQAHSTVRVPATLTHLPASPAPLTSKQLRDFLLAQALAHVAALRLSATSAGAA